MKSTKLSLWSEFLLAVQTKLSLKLYRDQQQLKQVKQVRFLQETEVIIL